MHTLSMRITVLLAFVETDKDVALLLLLNGSLVIPIIFEKAHAHARPRLNGSAAHWRVKLVVPTGGTNGIKRQDYQISLHQNDR